MKSFPKPLTASEESYYLQKYTEGDLEAKHILIERNLRLVAHVVKKYQHLDEDPEDLLSIGTIGLIKAVVTFNPQKGNRLATYAVRCIENAILSQTLHSFRLVTPVFPNRQQFSFSILPMILIRLAHHTKQHRKLRQQPPNEEFPAMNILPESHTKMLQYLYRQLL